MVPSRACARVVIALLWVGCASSVFGLENAETLFQELTAPGTSGERLDAIVTELSARPFAEAGPQALQEIVRHWGGGIYNPSTDKPWLEERCSDSEKVRYAASAIWHGILERAEPGSLAEPLAKLAQAPRPELERLMALGALRSRHFDERAREPLERLARDPSQPPEIGTKAAEILVRKVDANAYLRDLFAALDRIEDPLTRSERWRGATADLGEELSVESTSSFLAYGFAQLGLIDDGESGIGYFLALDLGKFLRIPPIRPGQGAFAPDQRLPRYQGAHGLNDVFFQETVDHARSWWRENQSRYTGTAPSPKEKTP